MTKKIFFFVPLTLCLFSCKQTTPYQSAKGEIQGTYYNITYQSNENLAEEIFKQLKSFDKSLSIFDSTSIITKVNDNAAVKLDSNFIYVFNRAMEVSKNTNGAFDMTVSPLVKLWGFNHAKEQDVTHQMIANIMPKVGYQKIRIKNNKIVKDNPSITLDANAIAQGYTSDIIANYFNKKGIQNYLVEIGGEVRAKGVNDKNEIWRVGMDKPVDDSTGMNNEIQAVIALKNTSIATSGNYHKFHIVKGKKYGHEINPATGYPVVNELLSVSIVTPLCIDADAYATACMILGLKKSMELCKRLQFLDGYFVYLDNKGRQKVMMTKGMRKMIVE